jgi:plastocyanin
MDEEGTQVALTILMLGSVGNLNSQGGGQMSKDSLLRVGVVIVAVGFSACTSIPEISRTQAIHDVKVEMELSPENVIVAPGDEVRWVNLRKDAIHVQIADLHVEDLSCQRGFANWFGQIQESVRVKPNETVSLCFKKPAVVLYNIRAETALGGGKRVLSGSVKVGNVPDL